MFTGIIEEVGIVKSMESGKLTISAVDVIRGTRPGDSIAVDGACLTVIEVSDNTFSVEVMPETIHRTNISSLFQGQGVNLERSLAAEGRFGGHFVQGHVDCTGRIASMVPEGKAVLMKVTEPREIMRYLVEKGYVAVDGVSLTIINCDAASFTISLVGYTREHTTLSRKRAGNMVNLEVDIIAKYLEKVRQGERAGISFEFLGEHGYLAT